jgi:hypothetical protein
VCGVNAKIFTQTLSSAAFLASSARFIPFDLRAVLVLVNPPPALLLSSDQSKVDDEDEAAASQPWQGKS